MVKYRRMTIEQACEDMHKRTEYLNLHLHSWRRPFICVELEGEIGYNNPMASQTSFRFVEKGRDGEIVLLSLSYLLDHDSNLKLLEKAIIKNSRIVVKGSLINYTDDRRYVIQTSHVTTSNKLGALSLYQESLEGALSMSYDEGALSLSNPEK